MKQRETTGSQIQPEVKKNTQKTQITFVFEDMTAGGCGVWVGE